MLTKINTETKGKKLRKYLPLFHSEMYILSFSHQLQVPKSSKIILLTIYYF